MIKPKLIIIFMLFTICLSATPNWYSADVTHQYPHYFIGKGFVSIEGNKIAEAQQRAKELALKDATSRIICSVSGETISHLSEKNIEDKIEVKEYFLNKTNVKTNLEVMGYNLLKEETDGENAYALIGIPINDMKNAFKKRIEEKINIIKEDFNIAEDLIKTNPKKSIKKLETCVNQSQNLKEDLQIYLFLNEWKNDLQDRIESLPSKNKLETKLTRLATSTPKSSKNLAEEIVKPFLINNAENYSFVFYPMEYENTGFVSRFGKNFADICGNIIIEENNWSKLPFSKFEQADLVFRGKIMEMDNGMLLSITMRSKTGRINKNNQLFVNKITCENIGWDKIKPENLENALKNKVALYKAIQKDNNLNVELRTDKITDGPLIYYFGEEPQILVRTNKSCYIRLIYIFSDDTKTLLKDNYFIATDQVNQWVKIPFEGVICEPSGVEQLILQASTEKQPSINYRRQDLGDGTYIDIIESDIAEPVSVTRGLKLKHPEKEITEKVYQWTIFAK